MQTVPSLPVSSSERSTLCTVKALFGNSQEITFKGQGAATFDYSWLEGREKEIA